MSYFKNFFRFTAVQADGDNEHVKAARSAKVGDEDIFEVDYALPFVEISPENEVLAIAERWYPSEQSFYEARDNNIFPCTEVTFSIEGSYLINWPMKEFKKRWSEFKDSLPKEEMKIVHLNGKEEIQEFLKQLTDGNTKGKEG
jgi:hypothetical protein